MAVKQIVDAKPEPSVNVSERAKPAHGGQTVFISRELIGLGFCLLAAVFYTGANISLRYLAGAGANPATVIFVKELVAVVALAPILIWQWLRGQRVFVSAKVVAVLVAIGLAVQLGANLGQQWALGIIGLAVASPTVFASMLGSSAILGLLLLGERLSWQAILAVILVVLAIVSLNISVQEARAQASGEVFLSNGTTSQTINAVKKTDDQVNLPPGSPTAADGLGRLLTHPWWIILALLTCCGAGMIYSLLGIAIRWARLQGATVESTVFLVTLMGVIGLGPVIASHTGASEAITNERWILFMLLSGIANLLGFAAITKGYQMTRVLYANMANATQVAFGALAGIILFAEPINRWLVLGVLMTLAGVLLMGYTAAQENHRSTGPQPSTGSDR